MEIKFKRDTSFRKQFFVPDSFAHPAKMDAQLLIWIVENYTKKWETILDPMAGSGTLMLACGLSRNVILVELEEKFCKMMWDNWAKVRMWPQLGHRMGTCDIIQGDARQLEGLLVDKIVTSPPYAETEAIQRLPNTSTSKGGQTKYEPQSGNGNIANLPYGEIDKCIFSPPYAEAESRNETPYQEGRVAEMMSRSYVKTKQGKSEGQIGNLPYGSIDKIVTSPPYAEGFKGEPNTEKAKQNYAIKTGRLPSRAGMCQTEGAGYSGNRDNLGNLSYGNIDAVISSPPYEGSVNVPDSNQEARAERLKKAGYDPKKYQGGKGRNLQQDWSYRPVDAVVTSPPFANQLAGGEKVDPNYEYGSQGKSYAPIDNKAIGGSRKPEIVRQRQLSRNIGNINVFGNKGKLCMDSYLEAMLQVYAQCWGVLKDGGLMVLVTKNFIRNKQIVRLDTDTIKLCEQAGFTYFERHYRKLPSQSFWRVIALLKCDHRKGSKQSPKCELGLECPIKEKEVLVFLLGLEPEARQEAVEVVEKLCSRFINSSPKIEFEDVLVFQKLELKV